MNAWFRRVRGALGLGLTWALAWFGAGLALALAFPGAADVPFPVLWGAFGFVGGVIFSAVLGAIEGRRRFEQLSVVRFAAWGGVGGFLLYALFGLAAAVAGEPAPLDHAFLLAPVFAVAGAGSAAGSLALARRADDSGRLGGTTNRREIEGRDGPPSS